MTTARDVIAQAIWAYRDETTIDQAEGLIERLAAAPEPARQQLAVLLNPWRPIESAPKDEMFIYYWPRDGKRCIGLAYRTVSGEWRDSEGNWNVRIEPTHWLPLPAPPKEDE